MKISIILATFNGEKYLPEQLQSLSKQTRIPHELIIGDDASEDRTLAIAREFAKTAPFAIKIIVNPERLGYMQNFSSLATQASGDILAFCDQDDFWEPNKLEVIERYFSQNPRVMCAIHDIRVTDMERHPMIPSFLAQLQKSHFSTNIFTKGCATAVRKELADASFPLPKNSAWSHDNIVHVVAMITGTRHVIHQTLIDHRIHKHNASGFIAPKPTIWRRLNILVDNFEMSRAPSSLYPIAIPKRCVEHDLRFLFDAASRISRQSAFESSEIYSCVRALNDLSKTRAQIKELSLRNSLRLIKQKRRIGAYQKIGGNKITAFEYIRIILQPIVRFWRSKFGYVSENQS
jgi:glycosyltransferase involved in cell wall biosynthesis